MKRLMRAWKQKGACRDGNKTHVVAVMRSVR